MNSIAQQVEHIAQIIESSAATNHSSQVARDLDELANAVPPDRRHIQAELTGASQPESGQMPKVGSGRRPGRQRGAIGEFRMTYLTLRSGRALFWPL